MVETIFLTIFSDPEFKFGIARFGALADQTPVQGEILHALRFCFEIDPPSRHPCFKWSLGSQRCYQLDLQDGKPPGRDAL